MFCFARRTQRKTGIRMKAQRRKMPGFDMDESYRQLGTFRVRRSGLKAGASSRSPNASRGWRGIYRWRRVSDRRVLGGSLGIRGIRRDFPMFCFARRTQRKTGTRMKAQRRKEPRFDMKERYGQLRTFGVRRAVSKAGASSRSPNASRGLEAHLPGGELPMFGCGRARKFQARPIQARKLSGGNPRFSYE